MGVCFHAPCRNCRGHHRTFYSSNTGAADVFTCTDCHQPYVRRPFKWYQGIAWDNIALLLMPIVIAAICILRRP